MKIITITLNPAIDKTIEVPNLNLEQLNKVEAMRSDVGGKGINVSRVLKALGSDSLAMGFAAGNAGQFILQGLTSQGIDHDFITVEGETRTNLKVFDRSTTQITEINEPGPPVNEDQLEAFEEHLKSQVTSETLVVLSGSIPKTLPSSTYAVLIKMIKEQGAKVFLDADGEVFRAAVNERPNFIKPNKDELERFFGKKLITDEDVIEAIRYFVELGVEHVFITMGKEGSYYGSKEHFYKMLPLKVLAHSSVGAGDAFVAAVTHAISKGVDLETMLKLAVATSAGAVTTVGTNPASAEWIDAHIGQVKLQRLGGI